MDEVEDYIRGTVDRWRVERRNTYMQILAHGTMKNPPGMAEMLPLPYDDELEGGKMSANEIEELYNKYEGLL